MALAVSSLPGTVGRVVGDVVPSLAAVAADFSGIITSASIPGLDPVAYAEGAAVVREHGPVLQQEPRGVDVAFLAGDEQRRGVWSVGAGAGIWSDERPIDLRAVVQQQAHRVDVTILAGDVQRRRTIVLRLVDLRASFQQQLRHVDVAVLAS